MLQSVIWRIRAASKRPYAAERAVVSLPSGAVVAQRSAFEVAQLADSARLGGEAVAQALELQRSLRVASAR